MLVNAIFLHILSSVRFSLRNSTAGVHYCNSISSWMASRTYRLRLLCHSLCTKHYLPKPQPHSGHGGQSCNHHKFPPEDRLVKKQTSAFYKSKHPYKKPFGWWRWWSSPIFSFIYALVLTVALACFPVTIQQVTCLLGCWKAPPWENSLCTCVSPTVVTVTTLF